MTKNLHTAWVVLGAVFLIGISSCTKEEEVIKYEYLTETDTVTVTELVGPGAINITLDNVVGSEDFDLSGSFTIDDISYSFDHFRYWVSNISLVLADGSLVSIPDSYYLMEECGEIEIQDGLYTYPATKREVIELTNIPTGSYTGIVFNVGVDSEHNENLSLQAGELSQMNGMTNVSWMWHTSYIFSSVEGTQGGSAFTVETGTDDTYREVSIAFDSDMVLNANDVKNINIQVNVAEVFSNLDLTTTPTVGASTPDEMTTTADNYQEKVFTFVSVD